MSNSVFDRTHLNLDDASECLYWCVHLDANHAELARAIGAVGNEARAVETYLLAQRAATPLRKGLWQKLLGTLRLRPPIWQEGQRA